MKRNKRFQVHFTPTSASWLNMVERFFRDISERKLRRGVFRSVDDLTQAITDYVAHHNESPNHSYGLQPHLISWRKLNAPAPSSISYGLYDGH